MRSPSRAVRLARSSPATSGVPSPKSAAPAVGAPMRANPAAPDIASATCTSIVTGTSFPFGGHSCAGVGVQARIGGVASRLILTDFDVVPPLLVAVQVNVVPALSSVTCRVSQPVLASTPVCGSLTSQRTVTSLVYQPSRPGVPSTCDITTGGVANCGH